MEDAQASGIYIPTPHKQLRMPAEAVIYGQVAAGPSLNPMSERTRVSTKKGSENLRSIRRFFARSDYYSGFQNDTENARRKSYVVIFTVGL